jgi:hypothetical protein
MNIEMHKAAADSSAAPRPAPPTRFAIITPTYYVDYEHCCWLVETVNRYVPEDIPHYLVIDRLDKDLFAPLASSRTRIVFKEDALHGELVQVPFRRRWWVGARVPPVRGWIVQQLTKLYVNEVADADVYIFVDSGCFFVKPFDPRTMEKDGQVRLFRESGEYFRNKVTYRWHGVSTKLLGIRPESDYDIGYVTQLITWRRDNLLMLQKHIERVTGKPPIRVLARQVTLSEYYVYGTYCDLVLGDRARHYHTPITSTLCYWGREPLNEQGLRELKAQMAPEHVLVLVDEKSRTPLQAVRNVFDRPDS